MVDLLQLLQVIQVIQVIQCLQLLVLQLMLLANDVVEQRSRGTAAGIGGALRSQVWTCSLLRLRYEYTAAEWLAC